MLFWYNKHKYSSIKILIVWLVPDWIKSRYTETGRETIAARIIKERLRKPETQCFGDVRADARKREK